MSDRLIQIAKEFSRHPGGRYRKDGPFSGEEFRDEFLMPALANAFAENCKLIVNLDGVAGYASSFLEEAFGGLVRAGKFDPQIVTKFVVVQNEDPLYDSYRALAERYMTDEAKRPVSAH